MTRFFVPGVHRANLVLALQISCLRAQSCLETSKSVSAFGAPKALVRAERPQQLGKILQDLGPRPPASQPGAVALWAAPQQICGPEREKKEQEVQPVQLHLWPKTRSLFLFSPRGVGH